MVCTHHHWIRCTLAVKQAGREYGLTGSEPPSPQTTVPRDNLRVPRETRRVWLALLATAAGLLVAAMIWLGRSPDGRPPRAVALSELGGYLSGKAYAKPLPDESQAQKHRPDKMNPLLRGPGYLLRLRVAAALPPTPLGRSAAAAAMLTWVAFRCANRLNRPWRRDACADHQQPGR